MRDRVRFKSFFDFYDFILFLVILLFFIADKGNNRKEEIEKEEKIKSAKVRNSSK